MSAIVRCDVCNNSCAQRVEADDTHPWLVVIELHRGRSNLQGIPALHLCDSCSDFAWKFLREGWATTAVREGSERE